MWLTRLSYDRPTDRVNNPSCCLDIGANRLGEMRAKQEDHRHSNKAEVHGAASPCSTLAPFRTRGTGEEGSEASRLLLQIRIPRPGWRSYQSCLCDCTEVCRSCSRDKVYSTSEPCRSPVVFRLVSSLEAICIDTFVYSALDSTQGGTC